MIGPHAQSQSEIWYWGGRIATLNGSLALVIYLNRNPKSFGRLIGRWVVFRNVFEVGLHIAAAAAVPTNWFHLYMLHWWIVAYRYLDVGPRRALQKLYGTPEKFAQRGWAPVLNWAVIALLYLATAWVVYYQMVLHAVPSNDALAPRSSTTLGVVPVIVYNLAVAVAFWIGTRKYIDSLLDEPKAAKAARPTRCIPGTEARRIAKSGRRRPVAKKLGAGPAKTPPRS